MKMNAVIFMGKRSVEIAILLVLTLTIFISVASAATTTYDYSSGATTDKWAWEVDSNDVPPNSVNSETALSTAQYTSIGTLDSNRWQMSDPGANDFISMKSTIDIQESAARITNILFHVVGYKSGANPQQVNIYGYNKNTLAWDLIGSGDIPAGAPDGTVEASLTANFDNYIDADGKMTWCFILNYKNRFLYVNYVKVDVTYITPTWGSDHETYDSTNHIVHMTGGGFKLGYVYKVGYYDGTEVGGGDQVCVECGGTSTAEGGFLSEFECMSSGATYGTWHSVVFDTTESIPATYNAAIIDANYVIDDGFTVQESAIPEFPAVIAAIAVCLLCTVAYVVMRRNVGKR